MRILFLIVTVMLAPSGFLWAQETRSLLGSSLFSRPTPPGSSLDELVAQNQSPSSKPSTMPPSASYPGLGSPAPSLLPGSTTPLSLPPGPTSFSFPETAPFTTLTGSECQNYCAGPYGNNGPIAYELYVHTGPSIPAGNSAFIDRINTGWYVGGGTRTLLFNQSHTAAWALDLGLSFTQNRGNRLANVVGVNANALRFSDPANNFTIPLGIRELRRTTFNFALGRDWWLNGPGTSQNAVWGNWRFGFDVGGRWGSASVGFEPLDDPGGYRRRQNVIHGVFLAPHFNWERPVGPALFFAGMRMEWGYNYAKLLPPNNDDLQDVNFLMSFGIRY